MENICWGVDYWQKNFADYVQGGFGGVL